MKIIKILLLCLMIFSFISCEKNRLTGARSGTMEEEDLEEPLSLIAVQYKDYVDTSNEILNFMKKEDYAETHRKYFSPNLQSLVDANKFKESLRGFGPIKSYKPLQWNFLVYYENDQRLLNSEKIVHYKNHIVKFRFVFAYGEPKAIVGIHTMIAGAHK